ncbi:MAG: TetR-like C-terminal domain-containing protein [Clostridium sp.]|uniref:TetR-like C-terminal domain-containing protein n=1 Tax=Clostridium sp. TaxID=1506 RepID=UPI003D6D630A
MVLISSIQNNFLADFYSHAFVGTITQWIKLGMKESPEILVDGIRNILEGTMPHALNRYAK